MNFFCGSILLLWDSGYFILMRHDCNGEKYTVCCLFQFMILLLDHGHFENWLVLFTLKVYRIQGIAVLSVILRESLASSDVYVFRCMVIKWVFRFSFHCYIVSSGIILFDPSTLFPILDIYLSFFSVSIWSGQVVDTIVMNPPFGTRRKGADMEFLSVALKVITVLISD